jgi:drug/metabolite transporter (DMT)-like permease
MSLEPPVTVSRRFTALPFLILTFCLLWSSAFAAAKLTLAYAPPLLLLAARFLVAAAVMFAVLAWRRGQWRMSARDFVVFAVLGLANNAVYLGLNYIGMQSASAGITAIIASANPVLTVLLAALFLNEPISWRKSIGLLLGVGGVIFIVQSRISGRLEDPIGIVCTTAGLISLVGGTILFKRLAPNGGLWAGNAIQNLTAGVVLLPLALTFERIGDVVPDWRLFAGFAYLALMVSVFAYLLWFYLLRACGATGASAYHFLMPPLGVLFGWLLLGERLEPIDLLGILPVALGIYLVTRTGKAVQRERLGATSTVISGAALRPHSVRSARR